MRFKYILLIPLMFICGVAFTDENTVNDMTAGTSISGPSEEQEVMYTPSAAVETYVGKYVNSAISKELQKNDRSISSLNAQFSKLKKDLLNSNAQVNANVQKQRDDLQKCVNILAEFKKNIDTNYFYIKSIKNELLKMGVSIEDSQKNISKASSDLESKIENNRNEFSLLSEQIDGKVSKRLEDSSEFEAKVHGYTWIVVTLMVVCVVGVLIAFVLCALLLKKLLNVQAKFKKLEDSVNLSKQRVSIPLQNSFSEPQANTKDHSFILKIADEVAVMETNLSGLKPEQEGYKQLKTSIDNLKRTARESGYEFVNYIGQDYKPNMTCDADFIVDESLPQGKSVIVSMVKMQVNYQGKMIQKPHFVVKQNLGY